VNFLEFLSQAITPLVVLILGIVYKGMFEKILLKAQEITVKLPPLGEIHFSSDEASKQLSEMFSGFYSVYNQRLKDHEKQFFRDLLNRDLNGEPQPTVKEMIPEFDRENDAWLNSDAGKQALGMLRAIRGLSLISPVGTRDWQALSKIEITEYGKALTTHLNNRL